LAGAAAFAGRGIWDLALPSFRVFAGSKLNIAFKSPFSATEKQNTYDEVTHYNNYYEFGVDKTEPAANAQILKTYPWTVSIEGEVKHPRQITIDEILKLAPLEERIYRHRCVEAWSIVIPWIGYSFSALAKLVEPTCRQSTLPLKPCMTRLHS
jgi:methionine sulfoxide reductase catalytic subunit